MQYAYAYLSTVGDRVYLFPSICTHLNSNLDRFPFAIRIYVCVDINFIMHRYRDPDEGYPDESSSATHSFLTRNRNVYIFIYICKMAIFNVALLIYIKCGAETKQAKKKKNNSSKRWRTFVLPFTIAQKFTCAFFSESHISLRHVYF